MTDQQLGFNGGRAIFRAESSSNKPESELYRAVEAVVGVVAARHAVAASLLLGVARVRRVRRRDRVGLPDVHLDAARAILACMVVTFFVRKHTISVLIKNTDI